MNAIFERELRSYLSGVVGYLFVAVLLLFAGIYTMTLNLKGAYPNFEYVLTNMSFIYIIAVPVLSMRVIAEERRQKTDQLLYSLPLSMTRIVLGKYLAMLAILAIPTLLMGLYPLLLSCFGAVPLSMAYGTLLGFFFLGAALLAMGLFVSSLTENPVVAALLCLLVMMLNYFISDLANYVSTTSLSSFIALTLALIVAAVLVWLLTRSIPAAGCFLALGELAPLLLLILDPARLEGLFPTVMQQLSLFDRFYSFGNGILDLTSLIYYLTVTAVFVFFTIQTMEKRRWS